MKFNYIISRFSLALLFIFIGMIKTNAQAILDANGPGKTYVLIDSILAPINNPAEETPDMTNGTHISFGRHIAEVWDSTLNKYVFEFYIHALIDNDVSTLDTDRQRVEIKTYEPSPDSMKGFPGDLMTFKWMFRLPIGFQPSLNFTHIHQIKGVDGDDSDPIFTLSPVIVNGTPKLCVRYVADSVQGNSNNPFTLLTSANLSKFLGVWMQVTEVVRFDTTAIGTYSIKVTKVGDTSALLKYSTVGIKTVRASNSFVRPKWGIYRSLLSPSYLRDDSLRLSHITIYKGKTPLPVDITDFTAAEVGNEIKLTWDVTNEIDLKSYIIEYSSDGTVFNDISSIAAIGNTCYVYVLNKPYDNTQFYRLKIINNNGYLSYSSSVCIKTNNSISLCIYPNPAKDFIILHINKLLPNTFAILFDAEGKRIQKIQLSNFASTLSNNKLSNGFYNIQLVQDNHIINNYPLIINK